MREFCTSGSVGGLGPAPPVPGLPDSTVDSRRVTPRPWPARNGQHALAAHLVQQRQADAHPSRKLWKFGGPDTRWAGRSGMLWHGSH